MNRCRVEQFRNYRKGKWQTLFVNNWWVTFFLLGAYLLFTHTSAKKGVMITQLEEQMGTFKGEIVAAREMREELLLRIDSQNDPRWIEMVLMQKLGLVPEGQLKVLFQKRS